MTHMCLQDQISKKLNNYYKFIKVAFKQPRKTLLNNIQENIELKKGERKKGKGKEEDWGTEKKESRGEILNILKEMGFDEKTRGQNLTIEELVELSEKSIF